MGARFRWLLTIGIIVALIAFALAVWWFGWDWTGLNGGYSQITTTSISHGTTTATVKPPGKNLWDLLQLLIIPLVLFGGGLWFNQIQKDREQRATDQRVKTERDAAEQRAKTEREIAEDNQREAALQAYIDKLSELLLKEHLGERTADGQLKPEYKQVGNVARVRTITVLTQLKTRRIGYVFAFLREAELMSVTKDDNAISLKNADLHAVDWSQTDLRGADLRGANLSGANLSGAIFFSIIYVPRALGGTIPIPNHADLSGADLSEANLSGAKVELEQLAKAASLKGATMPDGSKHL